MENEIKNTKPAVSSDTDSLGRDHNRSDDGRFTSGDYDNKLLDSKFSVPYFEAYVKPYLIANFYPGSEIIPGSKLEDDKGIDYLVVDENGNVQETFDLKTVTSAFGEDIYDEETPFALNLYKMNSDNHNWLEGSHLNTRHKNDGYLFLFIDTFENENEILKQIKNNATLEDIPDIYGCKAFCVPKEEFDVYINDKILSQDHVKDILEKQKKYLEYPKEEFPFDLFPANTKFKTNKKGYVETISYSFPLPGEKNIYATIKAYRQNGGTFGIRLFLPNKIFNQTSLKDFCESLELERKL